MSPTQAAELTHSGRIGIEMTSSFSVDALVSKYGGRISVGTSFKEYGSHRWGYYRTESTQAVTQLDTHCIEWH
jgi:hypothetical protein